MSAPIATYSGLKSAIEALPIAPGTVRVYRGQTCDEYPLIPSGLRKPILKQTIWHIYLRQLYQSLKLEVLQDGGQMITKETLDAYELWFHAVAQHYGSGSEFLDVTYSLDVALWFALHSYEVVKSLGSIGPPGAPDPMNDHPKAMELVRYQPSDKPGYVYVFDLPKWNGMGSAEAGIVVDLADAPAVFSSSPRMRVQQGCLVYCGNKNSSPLDMKTRLVSGTPLLVSHQMSDAPHLDWRVADLFPSPKKDEWYDRFLSVPMAYTPTPPPSMLRRQIPVTVYFDEQDIQYAQEVFYHNIVIPPPLLHRVLSGFKRPDDHSQLTSLHVDAIPIILEAPLIFPYPTGDSELWHQGLLARDIPDRCQVYDFATQSSYGEVPLTNVLFEFSPLEQIGWNRIVNTNVPFQLIRGIWLRRQGDDFAAALVYQDNPGPGPFLGEFIPFRYDSNVEKFVATLETNNAELPISDIPEIAKPIFIALMLLRNLSPALKTEATPLYQININEAGIRKRITFVTRARDAARLYRVTVPSPNSDWFVLRVAANSEEPFSTSATEGGDFRKLVTDPTKPFCDISLSLF
jgi:hypothetical protein